MGSFCMTSVMALVTIWYDFAQSIISQLQLERFQNTQMIILLYRIFAIYRFTVPMIDFFPNGFWSQETSNCDASLSVVHSKHFEINAIYVNCFVAQSRLKLGRHAPSPTLAASRLADAPAAPGMGLRLATKSCLVPQINQAFTPKTCIDPRAITIIHIKKTSLPLNVMG